jgi:hypothetical protein
MNIIYSLVLASILIIFLIDGGLGYLISINAQTPTTSDLPATIGNESTSDMGLTNNSILAQNTTTIYTPPPL